MQLISQGDIVVRALFIFLLMMLFASVYLFLIKAVSVSCRAWHARRFLCGLAQARSLQQVQELVDRQTTIRSFPRVAHRIMAEKKRLDAPAAKHRQEGGAHGAMAQRLIAHEAAEQAADLHQGLNVLAAMVWAAPLTGLAATAWRADWTAGGLWADGLALMQLGLVVAIIALLAYLCLLMANRMYLSQFVLFRQMVVSMLEPGGNVKARDAKPRRGFPRVLRSALDLDA